VASPAAAGNDKLSGAWRLDRQEPPGRPVEIDLTVAVNGDELKVEQVFRRDGEEPRTLSYIYVADGEPHETNGINNSKRSVTAKWRGKKLKAVYKVELRGNQFDVTETWSLEKGVLVIKYVTPLETRNFVRKQFYVRP
jgi:hypothetical protein